MYWTVATGPDRSGGMIMKAGLDGSNPVVVVGGLLDPYGIAIDFRAQRLYWADEDRQKIQSSSINGSDVQTVLELTIGSDPFGIVVLEDRIYFSTFTSRKLQSINKSGGDLQTHYERAEQIGHIVLVEDI